MCYVIATAILLLCLIKQISMSIKLLNRQTFRRRYFYVLILFVVIVLTVVWSKHYRPRLIEAQKEILSFGTPTNCSLTPFDRNRFNCSGEPAEKWCKATQQRCGSSMITFLNLFSITSSAVIDRNHAKSKRSGGERVEDVLNQDENDEYFRFEKDFLQISCGDSSENLQFGQDHLRSVFDSLTIYKTCPSALVINETTIAVNRYDYANIYHTVTDLYTVYLLSRFVGKDPKNVRILFIDAHPISNLDPFWTKMFHSFNRLGHINSSKVLFRELIWSPSQSKSEIDIQRYRRITPSFFDDFRQHILTQFLQNASIQRPKNCSSTRIFFLLRRNYVAHPRNPSGKVTRQLNNEKQVIEYLENQFSSRMNINFTYGSFEQISIEEQLKTVHESDIFIGIHGAGLTHAIFMSPQRALIELSTSSWVTQIHFELLASISQINYQRCVIQNGPTSDGPGIFKCISEILESMCPSMKSASATNPANASR